MDPIIHEFGMTGEIVSVSLDTLVIVCKKEACRSSPFSFRKSCMTKAEFGT